MKRTLWIFLILFSAHAAASETAVVSHCEKFPKPLPGGFCVHQAKGSNSDVLYHLHGKGGSEEAWANANYYTAQIRQIWAERGKDFPTVVSLSFGPLWLLSEKNSSPYSGLLETFSQQVVPAIEKRLGGVKGKRLLLGESMGGLNSVQAAFKTALFEKVAILCAPMGSMSPHDTKEEIRQFIESSTAWVYFKDHEPKQVLERVEQLVQFGRIFFPTEQEWEAFDPLKLAAKADISDLPSLYVAAGYYDPYVLYEGNTEFVRLLRQRGAEVEWRPQWGGHCAIDIPSLARFLNP